MKNKPILFLIAIGLIITAKVNGQSKLPDLSFTVYGGYGLLAPGSEFLLDNTSGQNYKLDKYGFGQAPHFGGGISLALNKNISVGLDADYLTGSKSFPFSQRFSDTLTGNYTSKHSALSLIPNLNFNLWTKPGYTIYNRLGLVIGLSTHVELLNNQIQNDNPNPPYTETGDMKTRFGIDFGFNDAIGVKFPVGKNLEVFGEINGFYLPTNPTSALAVYSSTQNGKTTITTAHTTYDNKPNTTFFSESNIPGSVNFVTYANTGSPSIHIYSIGINAGIIYTLKK
jgi:hypothetical protein